MKGLSQILYLIIAAAVLMMVALTLIFMVRGGIGDLFQDSGRQSCVNSIRTACQVQGQGAKFSPPGSCYDQNGNPLTIPPSLLDGGLPSDQSSLATCGGQFGTTSP
jgi:hypothetical protein